LFLISDEQADLVSETVNQNRSVFREEILEKDLVISKVLELVSKLSTAPLQLAFGGGTSLVKARGLMDRLSEDVDIKVITPEELPQSTLRSAMRAIRSEFQKNSRVEWVCWNPGRGQACR
jgi:predicted nucleotidyltransferase component of viral defense system